MKLIYNSNSDNTQLLCTTTTVQLCTALNWHKIHINCLCSTLSSYELNTVFSHFIVKSKFAHCLIPRIKFMPRIELVQ